MRSELNKKISSLIGRFESGRLSQEDFLARMEDLNDILRRILDVEALKIRVDEAEEEILRRLEEI
jgi:hypothetical protein